MFKKVIWLLKCIKQNMPARSFWNFSDFIKLIYLNYVIPFSDDERQYSLYEKKHSMFINYIKAHYDHYRLPIYNGCTAVRTDIDDQNIWVLWLQGEISMPEIVKVCYKNLIKNANGHKVILLTKDNLDDYLSINQGIKDKVGKGLSYIAFSDYIRLNLLSLYGGLWVDATFFITRPLDDSIFRSKFFSIKNNVKKNNVVCRYKWAVNFMYFPKNSEIILHIRNIFCAFWENNTIPINYLFIDYSFEYERLNNDGFDSLLSELPYSNEHSHDIRLNFNNTFDRKEYELWLADTSLFKLSYKGDFQRYSKDGRMSYYGYVTNLLN